MFVALGLASLIALTACAPAGNATVELPPQNRSEWTLPLDGFTYTSTPLRDYAEALLEKPCYAGQGIDWPVPYQPTDMTAGPSFSAGLQRLFNVELASKYGYHRAPNNYDGFEEWKTFVSDADRIAASTAGFEQAMTTCQDKSRSTLPLPSDEALYYAVESANTINGEAELDDDVVAAGARWATCMVGRGFTGLPPMPTDAPGDALVEKWQIGIPGTAAGTDEIQMATADAECGEESGWSEAYYQAVWDRQVTFVTDNADRLERIRTELDEDSERLLKAIAENAPTR